MGANTRATRSRASREALRGMLAEGSRDVIVDGLILQLKARMLELECRDEEIRNMRHSLGLHFENPDPNCEACQ